MGNRQHSLRASHHVTRSTGVVGRYGNVEGLRQRGDLLELRDTASPGHVGHDVIGQEARQHWQKLVARIQSLANRDPRRYLLSHLLECIVALLSAWLLEPADAIERQALSAPGPLPDTD